MINMRGMLLFGMSLFVLIAMSLGSAEAREVKKWFRSMTLVAYGDSFTAGYGVERKDAWPMPLRDMLNKEYERDRIDVVNAGVIGDTAASGAARLSSILREEPNLVIVAFGLGDALRGIDPSLTYKALDQILTTLTYNNIYVILCGFKAPDNYSLTDAARFNSMFPELADRYKVAYLPYLLQDVHGVWYNLQYDGIHPSEEGHEQIAKTLFKPMTHMITKIRQKMPMKRQMR